jgi:hypothetical protein
MIKGKLIKTGGDYLLRDMGGDVLAITKGTTEGIKLSKQNCDEIFGVIDVEKLATGYDLYEKINFVGQTRAYKAGFQKAMELNKDKLFTLEDIKKAMDWIMTQYFEFHEQPTIGRRDQYLESIQQPTEMDVEIEMEKVDYETKVIGAVKGVKGSGDKITTYKTVPKLDSEGCLILKKI